MTKLTLYHKASGGGTKQWSNWIEADGVTVVTEWGLVGGTLQRTSDTAKSKGKVGTKAFKDAKAVAIEMVEAKRKKKRDEGYVDDQTKVLASLDVHNEPLHSVQSDAASDPIFDGLPKAFAPAKPISSITDAEAAVLERAGKLIIQRKRDGQRHLALVTNSGDVKLYSRRMEDMTGNFPRLRQAIKDLGLPARTLLDFEVCVDRDGRDDFKAVATITKALPGKAAIREAELPVIAVVFDLLYLEGNPIYKLPYEQRFAALRQLIEQSGADTKLQVPQTFKTLSLAEKLVKQEGWEGLVLWDKTLPTVVRLNGKPKRVNCYKRKPVQERDFIAYKYETGTGSCQSVVGKLFIAEIDTATGKPRDCGKVGSGFTDSDRAEALSWDYPCVVKVKFDSQEPTGKLRFPVFLGKHEDKTPDEVVGPELDADEEA